MLTGCSIRVAVYPLERFTRLYILNLYRRNRILVHSQMQLVIYAIVIGKYHAPQRIIVRSRRIHLLAAPQQRIRAANSVFFHYLLHLGLFYRQRQYIDLCRAARHAPHRIAVLLHTFRLALYLQATPQ